MSRGGSKGHFSSPQLFAEFLLLWGFVPEVGPKLPWGSGRGYGVGNSCGGFADSALGAQTAPN